MENESWVESDEYTGPDLFKKNVLEDDDFLNKYGYLGVVYGKQWRAWKTIASEKRRINK